MRKISVAALLSVILFPLYASAVAGTISVEIAGSSFDVEYDAEGVTIISVEPNLDEIELILEVDVTQSLGILEITFDREFFDATFEGEDDEFFVIADGDFVELEEVATDSDSRTLRMELPFGTEEVEIFGTVLVGATFEEPTPKVEEPEVIEEEPEEEVMEEPPVIEEGPEEEVMEEPPIIETEKPKTECGPGTILKDGVCVLDERCGPSTHLENGVCVLDEKKSTTSLGDRPSFTQFIFGTVAAFIIAIIIILLLWVISRGSRQKQPTVNR